MAFQKTSLREIYQQEIQKLENDRQFKRYGIPINFIKLSDLIFRRDFSLEFIGELKGQSNPLPDMEDYLRTTEP